MTGHHFHPSKYFSLQEQSSFYSIHTLLLLNPAYFLFPVVRSRSAVRACSCALSLFSFSLSFFSLVDLLLWLWRAVASFQRLMGWEQEPSAASSAWDTLMSPAPLGCVTIHRWCFGVCGKNVNSAFQMFSEQLESPKWAICFRNITDLFRRWQWIES